MGPAPKSCKNWAACSVIAGKAFAGMFDGGIEGEDTRPSPSEDRRRRKIPFVASVSPPNANVRGTRQNWTGCGANSQEDSEAAAKTK
jgi:hypothetical protein